VGTPGASSVAGAPVTVQFIRQNSLVGQVETELDEHGVVTIEVELPAGMPFQPLVLIRYDGVTYTGVGPQMGPGGRSEAVVEVACYATTEEPPDWAIGMRHVLFDKGPAARREGGGTIGTAAVSEVIVVENEGDRTWIGETPEGRSGRRTTAFPLPAGVAQEHVQLGAGFNGWKETRVENGWLVNELPLMPGQTEFRFQYLVPADDGVATFALRTPIRIEQFMMIAPTELISQVDPKLQSMGERQMGERVLSQFMVSGLEGESVVDVTLAGLEPMAVEAEEEAEPSSPAKMVAIIGAGAILIFAIIFVAARMKQSGGS
jgi:hypothetical protein